MSRQRTASVLDAVGDALSGHDRVVLAVSGGLDSMVLLDAAMSALPARRVVVATFDHGTGDWSRDTAGWVVARAAQLSVECYCERATKTLTGEAALRAARWTFLRAVATRVHGVVVTAHTEDDQVETVLIRILRNAGARGLAGLYAESDVLRPFVSLRRSTLAAYARAHRTEWREDPSNVSRGYLRNRLRHEMLPALGRARPSIERDLLRVARHAAAWRLDVESFVNAHVNLRESVLDGRQCGVDVGAERLLRLDTSGLATVWPAIAARAKVVLDRRGLRRLCEFTKSGRVGARMQLSGGWHVIRSREAFELRCASTGAATLTALSLSNATTWRGWTFTPVVGERRDPRWSTNLPADASLSVRAWRAGDAVRGAGGVPGPKVKRLLSNAGITGHQRTGWPVVLAGEQVVWVPGVRRGSAAPDRSGEPGLPFVCEQVNR